MSKKKERTLIGWIMSPDCLVTPIYADSAIDEITRQKLEQSRIRPSSFGPTFLYPWMKDEKQDKPIIFEFDAKREKRNLSERKRRINKKYSAGTLISHTTFGRGIIKENTGTRLIVDFDDYGEKTLATFYCVDKNYIRPDFPLIEEKSKCICMREEDSRVSYSNRPKKAVIKSDQSIEKRERILMIESKFLNLSN